MLSLSCQNEILDEQRRNKEGQEKREKEAKTNAPFNRNKNCRKLQIKMLWQI